MRITASETTLTELRRLAEIWGDPLACPTRRCRRARRCEGALTETGYPRCAGMEGGCGQAPYARWTWARWTWPGERSSVAPTDPDGARP
jgi:hypothetical protein